MAALVLNPDGSTEVLRTCKLSALQKAVGGSITLAHGNEKCWFCVYANDEGLLRNMPRNDAAEIVVLANNGSVNMLIGISGPVVFTGIDKGLSSSQVQRILCMIEAAKNNRHTDEPDKQMFRRVRNAGMPQLTPAKNKARNSDLCPGAPQKRKLVEAAI